MKLEALLLKSLFAASLMICVLTLGAMLTAKAPASAVATAPSSAVATTASAG